MNLHASGRNRHNSPSVTSAGDAAMVLRLRRRFVVTSMAALLIILACLISFINFMNLRQIGSRADGVLQMLADGGGTFLPPSGRPGDGMPAPEGMSGNADAGASVNEAAPGSTDANAPLHNEPPARMPAFMAGQAALRRDAEMPFETRYFSVEVLEDGTAGEAEISHIAAVSAEEAKKYASAVLAGQRQKGYLETYRFLSTRERVLFVDCSSDFYAARGLLFSSLGIGAAALIAMLLLVHFMAGRTVMPVVDALAKQRQFISDAGHELKTPLSVISASADVLELESGRSKWTDNIRAQVRRMNELITSMLMLSRMEDDPRRHAHETFDFSETVLSCADGFDAVAEKRSINYLKEIAPGITVTGDRDALRQLTSILLDNAMKYVTPPASAAQDPGKQGAATEDSHSSETSSGTIEILLNKREKDGKCVLSVSNTCTEIPEGDLSRLFDRFYRADASRDRASGGFGIGLSVAKAIAAGHGGSIRAERDGEDRIRFTVTI
ncbi:MAG: HAMP domain-containing histidine kinase [Lachnospiraceae bacterium]|nr:HAMP domain-containing histidine kinase [Lachnospiraceae bacterium]